MKNQMQLLTQSFAVRGEMWSFPKQKYPYQEDDCALRDLNAHLIIKAVSWPPHVSPFRG